MSFIIALILRFFFGITDRPERPRISPSELPAQGLQNNCRDAVTFRFSGSNAPYERPRLSKLQQAAFVRSLERLCADLAPSTTYGPRANLVVSSFPETFEATILATKRDSYRRLEICRNRLGVDRSSKTLATIGDEFGITRERVRQIVASTLSRVASSPIGAAFRASIADLLKESGCVRVVDLPLLCKWFRGVDPDGLVQIIEAFYPGRSWTHAEFVLISREPREPIEKSIDATLQRIRTLRIQADIENEIERISLEESAAAGMPQIWPMLQSIARETVSSRSFSFTDFVRDFVAKSSVPVSLDSVMQSANQDGFQPSEGQTRNTVASIDGMYPLGHSTFGNFVQIFKATTESLDDIVEFATDEVESNGSRQAHAEELLRDVALAFPDAVSKYGLEPYRLAALLRERSSLSYLGRLVFAASAESARIGLSELVNQILSEAGGPLSLSTILERARRYRGISRYSIQTMTANVTEISPGMFDLPNRQLQKVESEPGLRQNLWL